MENIISVKTGIANSLVWILGKNKIMLKLIKPVKWERIN